MSEQTARDKACKLFKKECGTHYALRTAYVKGYAQGQGELAKTMLIESYVMRLQQAEEVIRFYADPDRYGSDDVSRTTGNKQFDIVCFDFDRNFKPGEDYAGRRAREYQNKYGIEP